MTDGGSFRGYAIVDWNGDGYLDIISRDLQSQANYYQSNCGRERSLMVSLKQSAPNKTAIGSRIWVTDNDGVRRFRDISAGSTNNSSSSPPVAHFGLGSHEQVYLQVRWPDGTNEDFGMVETGQWIQILRKDTLR